MDHHCPWFNNCVCFTTYKFFLLTLFYVVALSLFGVATMATFVKDLWLEPRMTAPTFHLTLFLLLGVLVTAVLGSFLCNHICMVLRNETTLESFRGPVFRQPLDSFDLGRYQNFIQVFGPRKGLWLLPVFTSVGDGLRFPTKTRPALDCPEHHPPSVDATYSTKFVWWRGPIRCLGSFPK
ncbi:hypothetical protein HPB48_017299 [Haemaphysalis longicornis]|uniref:Palmitoyltransferase n=1 Tax=Haemaphysalis longicornis TaxID=44386 RepID=A0A9J6H566_HAELO|nr:hypothetical protein HPB48_017299 [Haemaphysalis longicornis]